MGVWMCCEERFAIKFEILRVAPKLPNFSLMQIFAIFSNFFINKIEKFVSFYYQIEANRQLILDIGVNEFWIETVFLLRVDLVELMSPSSSIVLKKAHFFE